VHLIAEPGRFFVASAFTLAVNIIAKRTVTNSEDTDFINIKSFMYYVNDGVYGSFNCLMYDHATVEPTLLKNHPGELLYSSSVWGPTCDGLDCVLESCLLPELSTGDWIVFRDMGAYTMAAASTFNGMPKPRCYYVAHETYWLPMNICVAKKEHASGKLRSGSDVVQHELEHAASPYVCAAVPEM